MNPVLSQPCYCYFLLQSLSRLAQRCSVYLPLAEDMSPLFPFQPPRGRSSLPDSICPRPYIFLVPSLPLLIGWRGFDIGCSPFFSIPVLLVVVSFEIPPVESTSSNVTVVVDTGSLRYAVYVVTIFLSPQHQTSLSHIRHIHQQSATSTFKETRLEACKQSVGSFLVGEHWILCILSYLVFGRAFSE